MSGSKDEPLGTCFMMRSLYATANAAVVTGGTRFGMQIALENVLAAKGTVVANEAPSLKWWCQSSGLANVSVWRCSAILGERWQRWRGGSAAIAALARGVAVIRSAAEEPQRAFPVPQPAFASSQIARLALCKTLAK